MITYSKLFQHRWILLSICFNLIIHLVVAVIYYNPIDFVLQVETAREIARGKLLYRDINKIIYETQLLPEAQYPPLYLYTLAVLILLFGIETFTFEIAKLFLIIVNFLVAYLMYYLIGNFVDCI